MGFLEAVAKRSDLWECETEGFIWKREEGLGEGFFCLLMARVDLIS